MRSLDTRGLCTLQVGERSATRFHQFVGCDAEHVVPRSRRRPHLLELQQVGVDEHAQLSAVTKRGHAAIDFENLFTGWLAECDEVPVRHPDSNLLVSPRHQLRRQADLFGNCLDLRNDQVDLSG